MSINFNTSLMASSCFRSLYNTKNAVALSMQRLSTGIRLNSASDDAAQLSLSKKLDSRSSGLDVANNNIQTGISKLQTHEGYLNGISENLIRIRDLAIQSSNGIRSTSEREMIDNESKQLLANIQQSSKIANAELGQAESDFTIPIKQLSEAKALEDGYTVIETAADLQTLLNATPSGKFILGDNIDLSSLGVQANSVITTTFTGELNGNGYKITGMDIQAGATQRVGLFSRTNGATIKNLAVEGASVSAGNNAGILVGYMESSDIDNVYTTGTVNGGSNTGGLAGYDAGSQINDSYSSVNVSGTTVVGGLIGGAGASTINNSFTTGTVNSTSHKAAGLIGNLVSGTITNSYSSANVSSGGNVAGGLVGQATVSSSISMSYATGNVSGVEYAGGFIGWNHDDSEITYSYSTGNVTASGGIFRRICRR